MTPLIGATIGPVANAGGTAAPAYTSSEQIASVNQTIGLGSAVSGLNLITFNEGVSTGILRATAVSAYPATPTGSANAVVNNLGLALNSNLLGIPTTILSIGSTVVTSASSVEGFGTPSASGASTLAGLTVGGSALGALTINGSLFANPAANTELLNLLGIRIVLNEQIRTGDNIASAGITTNAIHIIFSNFLLGTNGLNGDIIVSHSQAQILGVVPSTAPEPGTWVQLIAGFGIVGTLARRRRPLTA